MTRFDADAPRERRKLFADAVTAHRTRGSAFLTVEAEPAAEADDGSGGGREPEAEGEEAEAAPQAPWIQFSEKTFNMDCTDEELDRLKAMLNRYPEFRIDAMESPEEVEGTNVHVTARSDANRLAGFVDEAFAEVYGLSEDYRAWVTAV